MQERYVQPWSTEELVLFNVVFKDFLPLARILPDIGDDREYVVGCADKGHGQDMAP